MELVLDLPYIFCALVILLTVWRLSEYRRRVKAIPPGSNRSEFCRIRKEITLELFFCVLFDFLALICYSIVILTVWGAPSMRNALKGKTGFNVHKTIFEHFFYLILDTPSILFMLVVSISWRSPILWKKVRNIRKNLAAETKTPPEIDERRVLRLRRQVCGEQFVCLLLDIPVLLFFILDLLFVWNFLDLWDSLKRLPNEQKQTLQLHYTISKYFWELILDLPYVICGLVIVLTIWRLIHFGNKLAKINQTAPSKQAKFVQRRGLCAEQCCCVLLDIPAVLCGLLVVISFWNSYPMRQSLKKTEGLLGRGTSVLMTTLLFHFIPVGCTSKTLYKHRRILQRFSVAYLLFWELSGT